MHRTLMYNDSQYYVAQLLSLHLALCPYNTVKRGYSTTYMKQGRTETAVRYLHGTSDYVELSDMGCN